MRKPTPEECAYFAGLFNGEGCVAVLRRPQRESVSVVDRELLPEYTVYSVIAMADLEALGDARAIWGGSLTRMSRPGCRTIWRWALGKVDSRRFFLAICPHLHGKRGQVELALKFLCYRIRPGKRLTVCRRRSQHRVATAILRDPARQKRHAAPSSNGEAARIPV